MSRMVIFSAVRCRALQGGDAGAGQLLSAALALQINSPIGAVLGLLGRKMVGTVDGAMVFVRWVFRLPSGGLRAVALRAAALLN